jgi:signal recognition particle receptor subunit beta
VVLVDTRRIEACFPAIDFFEQRGTPFVVAINSFDGLRIHGVEEVRAALTLEPDVPVMYCDARVRYDVHKVLVAVAEHALSKARGVMAVPDVEAPVEPAEPEESTPASWAS